MTLIATDRHGNKSEVFWGEIAPCEHLVQIYEDDVAIVDALAGFAAGGICAGEAVVVIATAAHLQSLEGRLRRDGIDLEAAASSAQYLPFEAEAALSKFMVNGWPNDSLFEGFVTDLLHRAGAGRRRVRAFGEMVAILWAQGHAGATVRLEHLWHRLCEERAFSLFCAYPRIGFTQDAQASVRDICAAHSKVIAS